MREFDYDRVLLSAMSFIAISCLIVMSLSDLICERLMIGDEELAEYD
jgi:hypothetical protein